MRPDLRAPARPTSIACLAAAIVPLLWAGPACPAPLDRAPVPDPAAVKKAESAVRDLFKAEYARRALTDRKALAERLLALGLDTKDDPVGRYVLLREACDQAAGAGEARLAVRAAGHLAEEYAVDPVACPATAVERAGMAAGAAPACRDVAEAALALTDEAVRAGRFAVALRLAALANRAAAKAKVPALAQRAARRETEVKATADAYLAVWELEDRLRADPQDAEAGRAVGRFHCLYQGDWAGGLPLLARFADGPLQAAARREAEGPAKAEDQLGLADAWWDLAGAEKGLAAANLRRRAAWWYRAALPGLAGLGKARAERRLNEADAPGPFDHLDLGNCDVVDDFVRLKPESAVGTREVFDGPFEATAVARTAGENIRLYGPGPSAVIFNWERNPRELRVHLPGLPESQVGRAQVRPLAPDSWYSLKWRVTRAQVDVWVDGKLVFTRKGTFDLSEKAPVQVRNYEHVVDVKSLAVTAVK